jgi:serine/threonine protein kinase
MELVKGGRLTDLIKERFTSLNTDNRRFTDKEASALMRGILSAVAYMHDKGIVHRDLKPDNILVHDKEDLNTCKVIDFGLSAKHNLIQGGLDRACGTAVYMAPEVLVHRHEYTKSVDIWSTGIIMYEVLTGGSHPLYVQGEDTVETYKKKL